MGTWSNISKLGTKSFGVSLQDGRRWRRHINHLLFCHKHDYEEDYQSKSVPEESVPKHPTVPFIPYSLAPDSAAVKEPPDITSKKENKDFIDNGNK